MKILKLICLVTGILTHVNILLAQQNTVSEKSRHITYLTGKTNDRSMHDTLVLVLLGPFYTDGESPEQDAFKILKTTPNMQGEFIFKIETENSPFHVSLFLSGKRSVKNGFLLGKANIDNYLINAGDSIHVEFGIDKQIYSGLGADLFNAQNKIEQTDKGRIKLTHDGNDYFRKDLSTWLKQKDSLLNVQIELLATFQSKLSFVCYGIVRADVIAANRGWVYRRINFAGPFFVAGTPLKQDLANLYIELERRPEYIKHDDWSSLSPAYIHYLYEKIRTEVKYERIIQNVDVFLNDDYLPAIKKQYTGVLRDKLLAYWLLQVASLNNLQPEYLEDALCVLQTPAFIQIARDLKTNFAKGGPILDYGFKDPKGKTVHLADFKGKVLMVDLWFSGCGGCVAVAGGLPQVEKAVNNPKNVAFISISIDKDKQTWLNSINKNPVGKHYTHYTTPTTTYLYTDGTAANNPFIKRYVPGGSYPSLLIIDKSGQIFSSTPSWPISDTGKNNLVKEIKLAIGD